MTNLKEIHYVPSLSMESMCHLRDTVGKKGHEKTIIALILVHGSWNAPRKKNTTTQQQHQLPCNQSFLQTLLASSVSETNNSDKLFAAGALQVDQDDETMACCLGDDSFHDSADSEKYNIPCPPATLPALAVAIQTPPQSHARIQYISDIPSSELLLQMNTLDSHSDDDAVLVERSSGLAVLTNNEWTTSIGSAIGDLLTQDVISSMSNSHSQDDDAVKVNNKKSNASIQSKKRPIVPVASTLDTKQEQSSSTNNQDGISDALRIFVAGDRSSVGKSSVCLGIIGTLIHKFGYAPSSLAYIKPATQCEARQLVQAYCDSKGIACRAIGPLVYYKGFTRAFLAGETGQTTEELLAECGRAVDEIAQGKRIVLVDGVGFPAVGSICGTDNASVAIACGYPTAKLSGDTVQRRPPGVIVVGGSGVGAAVDAFNLNASYFEMGKVPVMGGIFNKLSTEGYYSLENCKQQLTSYFQQSEFQKLLDRAAFGFVPLFDGLGDDDAIKHVDKFIQIFGEHVDIKRILEKATRLKQQYSGGASMDIDPPVATAKTADTHSAPLKKRFKSNAAAIAKLSRADIERSAAGQGAATA